VVQLTGVMDVATTRTLASRITAATADLPPRIVLDLARVTFCDYDGIGALIGIWRASNTFSANPAPAMVQ
jgi:anti-anti-sigma regulatory factor